MLFKVCYESGPTEVAGFFISAKDRSDALRSAKAKIAKEDGDDENRIGRISLKVVKFDKFGATKLVSDAMDACDIIQEM